MSRFVICALIGIASTGDGRDVLELQFLYFNDSEYPLVQLHIQLYFIQFPRKATCSYLTLRLRIPIIRAMAITEKHIKMLWGRAAGRCSAPDCNEDLTPLLEKSGLTILGEMAHVIGRRDTAARSEQEIGADDSYENLILLCPNHHTLIDKAPNDFPTQLLHKWKSKWEGVVSGLSLVISTRRDLFKEIHYRLVANHQAHSEWGPTSLRAQESPLSCHSAATWQLRRLGLIVSNNRAIVGMIEANRALLLFDEWPIAAKFIEHAQFYEQHCINPADSSGYLKFPETFSVLVERRVNG